MENSEPQVLTIETMILAMNGLTDEVKAEIERWPVTDDVVLLADRGANVAALSLPGIATGILLSSLIENGTITEHIALCAFEGIEEPMRVRVYCLEAAGAVNPDLFCAMVGEVRVMTDEEAAEECANNGPMAWTDPAPSTHTES